MLSNEKYIGNVRLLDSVSCDIECFAKGNIPPIISTTIFNKVQEVKNEAM